MFSPIPRIAPRPPGSVPMAETPETGPTLGCREAVLIGPVESGWWAAATARVRPPPELVWMEAHGGVTHGIDRAADAAMAILLDRIGPTATRS
jgi:hypothetical protein